MSLICLTDDVGMSAQDELISILIGGRKYSPEQKTLIDDSVRECLKSVKKIIEVDLSLQEWVYNSNSEHQVIPYKDFQNQLDTIRDDSLIIYIKKAQLFKIYDSDKLTDFENDHGTHYRKPEHGPAYEVVRDTHPQKLMIVVSDDLKDDKLQNIKTRIVEFVGKMPEFSEITARDLRVYSNDNNTEFVVSSVRLKDVIEKEKFIERFFKFMRQKGDNDIADKIQLKSPPSDEIDGVRFYKLPSVKIPIDNINTSIVDELISTSVPSGGPVIINNTFIINNGVIGTINKNKSVVQVEKSVGKKTLKTFCKYIYDTKPSWYKEDTFVDIDVIENAYRLYFTNSTISKAVLAKNLKNVLYDKSMRSSGTTKKRLLSFELLRTSF